MRGLMTREEATPDALRQSPQQTQAGSQLTLQAYDTKKQRETGGIHFNDLRYVIKQVQKDCHVNR